jgi:hypothetical protein
LRTRRELDYSKQGIPAICNSRIGNDTQEMQASIATVVSVICASKPLWNVKGKGNEIFFKIFKKMGTK